LAVAINLLPPVPILFMRPPSDLLLKMNLNPDDERFHEVVTEVLSFFVDAKLLVR
jgi:hypothetical protein